MFNPHQVTREFEHALCEYTGARFAVTTTSCTMAILLACAWWKHKCGVIEKAVGETPPSALYMPKHSYLGVPASIRAAGWEVRFVDKHWIGEYEIFPLKVWDSARRFTSGMFRPGEMQCVSFHAAKILADSQGGAILHDNEEADAWFRRARFDGRTEGVDPKFDQVTYPSWHAYMSPDVAARLLWKLTNLPRENADLPNSDYPDLSTLKAFQ